MANLDPIEFELFKNALFSIADEMALTVHRTTYSAVLKDNMDYSTAFCDAEGRLVAQGLTLPSHLGSIPEALAAVMRRYGDTMAEGDIFVLNDPFEGGMHLPDIFLFQPIYMDGERVAIAATICHHTDVGGRVPGSNASDSTEIYQEGLRIPPLRLYERGVPNATLHLLIERNVRVPVKVFGDLRAQLAACTIAERAFKDLVARTGLEQTRFYMNELLDYAERLTRAALRDLPDGEWRFEDHIDDDGVEVGRPIPLRVRIEKRGDHMLVDWTSSSPQVKGAINNTFSYTRSAAYCAVKSILPANIPNNEGYFRAIEVIAPKGTIAHGELPAACAARGLTGFRMVDCLFGALAQMLPDRVGAAGDGGNIGVSIGGYTPQRQPFIYVDFTCSAWGGRPFADGCDGNSHMFANMASPSIEVTETEQPIQILKYEFLADTMGAGQYRGGAPFCREYRFLEAEGVLQVRADRRAYPPFGLQGGGAGAPSMNWLTRDGATEALPSKFCITLQYGDVFRLEVPGGGGWGDPFARDPAAVLADARNGLVSVAAARAEYGVAIAAGWTVDAAATTALRAGPRAPLAAISRVRAA
ncbi:hydantoinase B/oxoprolinase family protein [Dankookia rubra]|uniref:Hydantoinase B/oxoprolinase family protein n=1 Tax=Dankookia rubra TaxID=1442381 RepID=A0A4R5QEV7_9PROT|nr:hydantoinase B/oxoprolinase family protein [Dankookia rubra]TDH61754.1 hydantoinase B/oxoprolinase family protein [Dankookia rubra]